jgi:DnaJ-class molecular chaperone
MLSRYDPSIQFRCPECDGAGFIRKAGSTLRANAARKDQAQIVCPNCNGLGKLGQIDKQ